ncbi:hypothetical protein RHIZO_00532 [Rhizobiaceae bacterium]|nr:hypothetical protein RHIZO_00532 [Rhizobiaceae bacterium]
MKPFGPIEAALLAGLALAGAAAAAPVADRWQQAGSGAVALLPKPQSAKGIASATLYCIEQRWSFLFRVDDASGETPASGILAVGGEPFAVEAAGRNGALDVEVPFEILQPLREAARMGVVFGESGAKREATFSLKGSRDTIDAIAPRCSQVDMSAFERVVLSPADPAVAVASTLLAEEAGLFRAWSGTNPEMAAASVDLGEGKALLFASLCGSTSYYGLSGCTIAGFARAGAGAEWKLAYNTEGSLIHLDRSAANGGFPNVVSLPMVGSTTPSHWVWTGEAYELREEVMAEQDMAPEEEGDTSQ